MNVLTLSEVEKVAILKKEIQIDSAVLKEVQASFEFLQRFSADKIIYGINTGFGPMAQFRIQNGELNQLQYNLIRSHSAGTGQVLEEHYARAVMQARLNSLLQAKSGVSPEVVHKLVEFLNAGLVPEIFEHGGVGASGDLVQLAHLGLNLIGEGFLHFRGQRMKASEAFIKLGISPLQLTLRDGLAILNGTSCMTGIAAINLILAQRLCDWSVALGSALNEAVNSFDDSFSAELNEVKWHDGQRVIASKMRHFTSGSRLLRNRSDLFKDNEELLRDEFQNRIQEYYSIRCIPQILGPVIDTFTYACKVVENELNSTNDNPVVIPKIENVFHGGNFHGDYISLEMDKVKLALTKLCMLAERQMNFLMNPALNRKFPAFLNKGKPGLHYGFQGLQFTATSTTAENQMLSNSMYVHSIPNNNDNQDIVSMGTNSALITKRVLDNTFQVMAIHGMAVCEALGQLKPVEFEKLSENSRKLFALIRSKVPVSIEDKPLSHAIEVVNNLMRSVSII